MTDFQTDRWVSLLVTLPERIARDALDEMRAQVTGGTWIDSWRGSTPVQPAAVVDALRAHLGRIPETLRDDFGAFCDALERTVTNT
ncbi:hypothetical protein [Cellulomonas sp. Leaf334]|uniref:hypothetical protein n=1 Tax=Cellulomonas sp. Leaf334 TaxID=1736339 RepID=UPI00138F7E79|nr:hypothetical protein [Cellulomonas sp. Leaf334]